MSVGTNSGANWDASMPGAPAPQGTAPPPEPDFAAARAALHRLREQDEFDYDARDHDVIGVTLLEAETALPAPRPPQQEPAGEPERCVCGHLKADHGPEGSLPMCCRFPTCPSECCAFRRPRRPRGETPAGNPGVQGEDEDVTYLREMAEIASDRYGAKSRYERIASRLSGLPPQHAEPSPEVHPDTQRLDWLEAECIGVQITGRRYGNAVKDKGCRLLGFKGDPVHEATVRGAIDAARGLVSPSHDPAEEQP